MSTDWITAALEETFNLPFRQFHKPNVPHPFASQWEDQLAHHDLRLYAQRAILPPMDLSPSLPPLPPPNHRSHRNRLAIEHETYRRLDYMYSINAFPETAEEFSMVNLPFQRTGDADFDTERGDCITIPALGFQINSFRNIGRPSDVDRVLRWVTEYPLATVNHMMHLVYPATTDYTIEEGRDEDKDKKLFRWAVWGRDEVTITEAQDTWSESVMVFVQPPWIVTMADLASFADRSTFPPSNAHAKLKSSERLWAKIWDLCTRKHSHWFVLTTYWGWVFGAFSPGWTRAFTSDIIPFDSKEPTIVQCLFFWFSSAVASQVDPHGAWPIPEVPEPIDADGDVSIANHVDPVDIEESESSWNAHSNARSHSPSAADSDDDADTVMLELMPDRGAVLPVGARGALNLGMIAEWMQDVQAGVPHPHPHARPPSEAPSGTDSHTTINSVSTVRDLANNHEQHGILVRAPRGEPRLDYDYAGARN